MIAKKSKDYEDSTGAALAARDAREERLRNEWIEKYEQETLAAENLRKQQRNESQDECTSYILAQSKELANNRLR